jgi:hypothetical protein
MPSINQRDELNVLQGLLCLHQREHKVMLRTTCLQVWCVHSLTPPVPRLTQLTKGVQSPTNNNFEEVRSSWTRGLAVTPVAAGFSFIALLLGLSQHLTVTLIASLTAFFAAVLTLIAFAIDIALFAYTRHRMNDLDTGASTKPGPGMFLPLASSVIFNEELLGFWLTLASLILLVLGGCTVCLGRRRDRATTRYEASDATATHKSGFMSRFRFGRGSKW